MIYEGIFFLAFLAFSFWYTWYMTFLSSALKIHMSEACCDALHDVGGYKIESRGTIDIKVINCHKVLAWISNYMPGKVWGEITYPFLNFNGATVEV